MSAASHRTAQGGLIDRATTLAFQFDGRPYTGHPGDTLASALMANGVRLVGRSFKYHRPRGVLSAGSEEPNALVELRAGARREPNTRATTVELYDGLVATSQNRWPSLAFDALAVNQLAGPILAAGFYYKTFMWPASFWEKLYEPLIRRAAGLGRAAAEADPDRYEKATLHCDVLVIGGGPAGLMAALAAARTGARVVIADEDARLGGRLLSETRTIEDEPGQAFAARIEAELAAMPDVTILRRTTVFGVFDGGTFGALEKVNDHVAVPPAFEPRQRLWHIVAQRSVLAAGSLERPLVFGDNDRPGVMLAGAVRAYANRFGALAGQSVVVFGGHADAMRTVGDLAAAGAAITAVVDPRPAGDAEARAAAEAAGARYYAGAVVRRAHGTARAGVQAVDIVAPQFTTTLNCDVVAMSGGWNPTLHLTCHLGGKPAWDEANGLFVPGTLPPGMAVVGAAAGAFGLSECLTTGAYAGLAAAEAAGFSGGSVEVPRAAREKTDVVPLWHVEDAPGKSFVDFQNDVTVPDIALAARENFRSAEHMKRYTTLGMATDQGKTSAVNGVAILAALTGRTPGEAGTTTFRPPYTPVSFGAMAGHARGRAFRPTRLTAAHDWAAGLGASFVESGVWMRAEYFPQPGEKDWLESCTREAEAVRRDVGICDVSTLGKIDIQGPDAATFLDRLYTNTFSTLPVGKARYGLMLREDGFVFDDGTTSRLGPDHFLMTTTTANAGKVLAHMEHAAQWIWPELDVQMCSVTEQWAQFAVAGPKSRELLRRVIDAQHDISDAAFPFMAAADMTAMGGITARLFRISFSGERAYEIGMPSRYGDALAKALMAAGRDLGVVPYGLEALSVLRIEKGHVAGAELNGQTTAHDLGLGKMVSTKKDFIGRVMAQRPALTDPDRPVLVGFRPVDKALRPRAGGHFVDIGRAPTVDNDLGHVTSVAYSPVFGQWIGLGLMRRGASRHGETVRVWDGVRKTDIPVVVGPPCAFDPTGERMRG